MRKMYLLITVCLLNISLVDVSAQITYQTRLSNLENRLTNLSSKVNVLSNQVAEKDSVIADLKKLVNQQGTSIDSLQNVLQHVQDVVDNNAKILGDSISLTNTKVDETALSFKSDVKNRSLFGIILIVIAIIIAIILFFVLRKHVTRGSKDIESLKSEAIKLDSKLVDILDKQVATIPSQPLKADEIDHSLALKVADEITRMELNLSRMDPDVRGYKQLGSAVKRIKNNFSAKGYEITDMLGKPYKEGMNVNATFITNDELEEGQQIITSVTKPEIIYKGTLIQQAQITVSQNI